jgi:hypothetical protein
MKAKPKTVRVRATIEYEPDNYVSLKQERRSWLGTLGEINAPGECWGLKRLKVERVPEKRRAKR